MEKYDSEEYNYFAFGTEYAITELKDEIEKEYDKVKFIALTEDSFPDKDKVYLMPYDALFPSFKFCNFEEDYKLPSHIVLSDCTIGMLTFCKGDRS